MLHMWFQKGITPPSHNTLGFGLEVLKIDHFNLKIIIIISHNIQNSIPQVGSRSIIKQQYLLLWCLIQT